MNHSKSVDSIRSTDLKHNRYMWQLITFIYITTIHETTKNKISQQLKHWSYLKVKIDPLKLKRVKHLTALLVRPPPENI
ncbi:hypothetical protein GCM10023116_05240 [Kistimonas scapharcae]|uniref:Uncharacterized protein n=1 Tax=Kistimonas scapharcae TaxID=1036133 RepID=A0ABP8V0A2_9GAMM